MYALCKLTLLVYQVLSLDEGEFVKECVEEKSMCLIMLHGAARPVFDALVGKVPFQQVKFVVASQEVSDKLQALLEGAELPPVLTINAKKGWIATYSGTLDKNPVHLWLDGVRTGEGKRTKLAKSWKETFISRIKDEL